MFHSYHYFRQVMYVNLIWKNNPWSFQELIYTSIYSGIVKVMQYFIKIINFVFFSSNFEIW